MEDNNDSASFYGGIGGSLCDGKVSYAALTHIGPENPGDNHNYRYLSDLTFTWRATDKFTAVTDLNYGYEESFRAQGYGISQYFTYQLCDWLTAGVRGEVWRDADGFFVAQLPQITISFISRAATIQRSIRERSAEGRPHMERSRSVSRSNLPSVNR